MIKRQSSQDVVKQDEDQVTADETIVVKDDHGVKRQLIRKGGMYPKSFVEDAKAHAAKVAGTQTEDVAVTVELPVKPATEEKPSVADEKSKDVKTAQTAEKTDSGEKSKSDDKAGDKATEKVTDSKAAKKDDEAAGKKNK